MQREDQPAMATGLERIAAKARSEPKLRFTSLAHHITPGAGVGESVSHPRTLGSRCGWADGIGGEGEFEEWIEPMLQSMHRQGYQAPEIRRVYIPKPGKPEKRPLGVPCVPTGRSSAALPRCCPPSTSRTFCPAPLAAGQD